MTKTLLALATASIFPSDGVLKQVIRDAKAFKILNAANKYNASDWTETTSGTSAAIADNLSNGGGILLTAGSSSGKEAGIQSTKQLTPLAGRVAIFGLEAALSNATTTGFYAGFGNVQADPQNTDYTDCVVFRKATGAATCVGRVRGNSGTASNSSTLATFTANAKQYLSLCVRLDGSGGFFNVNGTQTELSSNQVTQLLAILTTPPTDWGATLHAFGSSGNPALSARAFWIIA